MKQQDSLWKDSFPYGLTYGVASILVSFIFYLTNLMFEDWVSYLSYFLAFAFLYWGTQQYRDKKMDGFITWGRSWQVGTVMSIYAGILTAIYSALLFLVIDPDLISQMFDMVENKMLENPNMTDDAIDASMAMVKRLYSSELMMVYSLFGTIVLGMSISLLTSIFTRKKINPVA